MQNFTEIVQCQAGVTVGRWQEYRYNMWVKDSVTGQNGQSLWILADRTLNSSSANRRNPGKTGLVTQFSYLQDQDLLLTPQCSCMGSA